MTLDQRDHVTVARPAQQITLPVSRNSTIFDFRRSLADRNGIDDLALRVPVNAGVPRAADVPLRSQMPNQLLFQRSARLQEQAAVNSFVRRVQALIVRVGLLQPSGNLLRRPVPHQFTRNQGAKFLVESQATDLRPQGRLPGLGVGFVRSILRAPAMAGHLSAYRGASATQMWGDGPHRTAAGDSAGDVFSFGQCQRTSRTATYRRSDPPVARQQKMDDLFILAECSSNRI